MVDRAAQSQETAGGRLCCDPLGANAAPGAGSPIPNHMAPVHPRPGAGRGSGNGNFFDMWDIGNTAHHTVGRSGEGLTDRERIRIQEEVKKRRHVFGIHSNGPGPMLAKQIDRVFRVAFPVALVVTVAVHLHAVDGTGSAGLGH